MTEYHHLRACSEQENFADMTILYLSRNRRAHHDRHRIRRAGLDSRYIVLIMVLLG